MQSNRSPTLWAERSRRGLTEQHAMLIGPFVRVHCPFPHVTGSAQKLKIIRPIRATILDRNNVIHMKRPFARFRESGLARGTLSVLFSKQIHHILRGVFPGALPLPRPPIPIEHALVFHASSAALAVKRMGEIGRAS